MKKNYSILKFKFSIARQKQLGQTLIETMVAIFILVMGVTAAVGLAIYAFNSSTSITKQIVATGLAREAAEAVKNMRDTNWLKDTISPTGCYNFTNSQPNSTACYINWLGDVNLSVVPFCLNPTNNNGNCQGGANNWSYNLGFDSSAPNFWSLNRQAHNCGNNCDYGLLFNQNGGNTGFYSPGNGVTCASGSGVSDYCRKITLNVISNSNPYDKDSNLPLLQVQSQVWWVDKKCPRSADWPGLGKCSVEIDTYLTNWKDF